MEGIKGNIHLTEEERRKQRMKPMDKKYMYFRGYTFHEAKRNAVEDEMFSQKSEVITSRRRRSLNTIYKPKSRLHVWAYRITALFAILLLISFYFIPFPINLFLFITFLVIFIVISFWAYIRRKRQAQQDMTDCSSVDHDENDTSGQGNITSDSQLNSTLINV